VRRMEHGLFHSRLPLKAFCCMTFGILSLSSLPFPYLSLLVAGRCSLPPFLSRSASSPELHAAC
jgi:hypothetical protein